MGLVVDVTGWKKLIQQAQWMGKLDDVLNKPEVLVPAIRQAGKGMRRHFKEERSPSDRPWQHLTYYTLFDRAEHGHTGNILHRSGQLEIAACVSLEGWRALGNREGLYTKQYNEGDKLTFIGSNSSRHFQARLTGERVRNQFGTNRSTEQSYFSSVAGTTRHGQGYLPARPFWGFNEPTVRVMATASMMYIMQEWQSNSGGVATLNTGFTSTMGEGAH